MRRRPVRYSGRNTRTDDDRRRWEARTGERKESSNHEKKKRVCFERASRVAFTRVISFVYSLVKTNKQTDGQTCVVHVVVVVIRVFFAINS